MTRKSIAIFIMLVYFMAGSSVWAQSQKEKNGMSEKSQAPLSLITASPEEGFQLAIKLARKGVTTTQPDKEILHMQREVYSRDANSLIAASQVIAIYFQTIATANDFWRDKK